MLDKIQVPTFLRSLFVASRNLKAWWFFVCFIFYFLFHYLEILLGLQRAVKWNRASPASRRATCFTTVAHPPAKKARLAQPQELQTLSGSRGLFPQMPLFCSGINTTWHVVVVCPQPPSLRDSSAVSPQFWWQWLLKGPA